MPIPRTAASVVLLFLVCGFEDKYTQGFLLRSSRSTPSSRCVSSVNDYFDSFSRKESDGEKKSIGVNAYLQSLSRGSSERSDQIKSTDGIQHHGIGGMFDVQNNYFKSLGSDAASGEPDTKDTDEREMEDSWDYAAFLSFNIGIPEAATNTDPWQMVAAVQRNHYLPEETTHDGAAFNDARLCPKMLLTQRAVQTFICCCKDLRDPHSGKWLEDFLQLPRLGNFHGTGAFDVTRYPTWDAVLNAIMQCPNEKMIVSAKRRGRGHGGWSKNNPYLQERWVDFSIDIRPASLVHRILPIRRQLVEEFVGHLQLMQSIDEHIQYAYFKTIHDTGLQITESFSKFSSNCLTSLTNSNFDLLRNLCTQAAAHRLLRDLHSHSAHDPTTQWFTQFYSENAPLHFDGHQSFGRADAFMDRLVGTPPLLALKPEGEPTGWTNPIWIAEKIVSVRSDIAAEWMGTLGTPEDELKLDDDLMKMMLDRTIESSNERSVLGIEEEQTEEMPHTTWE